jgi:2-polyprenyl-3-methyl-5-hydroxy-6-metoxy-1,4-benzoquinol methylase
MNRDQEESSPQARWDEYGKERIRLIRENPERFLIQESPHKNMPEHADLTELLGRLEGKSVLELGCGFGEFTVYLAGQGAEIIGVDLGPNLIAASEMLAKVNNVTCGFRVASVLDLPFRSSAFDLVTGIDVLHHLSPADLKQALRETHRVLRPGGRAIFREPVENSRIFNLCQNVFPTRRAGTYSRPSILQRRAWRAYLESLDDRDLTSRELRLAGEPFQTVCIKPVGFLIRLERLIGQSQGRALAALDRFLFRLIPPLQHLGRGVLVEYRKE